MRIFCLSAMGRAAFSTRAYLMILVTRPAPTVRPPSRMANRRPSSMAIGWINSTVMVGVVTRHAHLGALRQGDVPGHISGPEVELRPVVAEERLVTTTLVLGQHIHLTLEGGVRRDRTRLRPTPDPAPPPPSSCPATTPRCCHPPDPHRGSCGTSPPRYKSSSRSGGSPRSRSRHRCAPHPAPPCPSPPCPRPVIVNTSSIGIKNGLSVARSGCGIYVSTAVINSKI